MRLSILRGALAMLALVPLACGRGPGAAETPTSSQDFATAPPPVPHAFSADFNEWLQKNGYGAYGWANGKLPGTGGRANPSDPLAHTPVVFVHGNGADGTGWDPSVAYFLQQGYSTSELYVFTWGDGTLGEVATQTHSAKNEKDVRGFLEAVKAYTGAARLDIVSHSMGETLARKAVKGGPGVGSDGAYDLGPSLTSAVDTFVGIAGANQGLISAYQLPAAPASNTTDGYYPGFIGAGGHVLGQSKFIQDINSRRHYEGTHVFSIWSPIDEIINVGAEGSLDLVWGVNTCKIPGQDGEKSYPTYGHYQLLSKTGAELYKLITQHKP